MEMWRASYNLFCDNGASAASSLSAKCSHTFSMLRFIGLRLAVASATILVKKLL